MRSADASGADAAAGATAEVRTVRPAVCIDAVALNIGKLLFDARERFFDRGLRACLAPRKPAIESVTDARPPELR